jgi:UDP-glucose 4-epimerase
VILVTGALGFIGAHTTRALIDAGEEVLAVRHRSVEVPSFLRDDVGTRLAIEHVDLMSPEQLRSVSDKYSVDSILHLAAPAIGALDAASEFRFTMSSLINVLELGRERNVRRVSIASSIAVYLGLGAGPFDETMPVNLAPTISTAAYKKALELLARNYGKQTGLKTICIRIGQIYGPGYRSLINLPSRLVHAAVRGVVGPLETAGAHPAFEEDAGDYCYVKDCARGIQLLHMTDKLSHTVYNIGQGHASTARDLAEAVQSARSGAEFIFKKGRGPGQVDNPVMSIGRAHADVGYEPRFTLRTASIDYIEWLGLGNDR